MAKEKVDKNGFGFDYGRQMKLNMRQKSLVCFCNHLKVAEKANYNEIHGKYSVINIKIQDYSQGKGDKSSFVEFNLDPPQVKTIRHWVSVIYPAQLGKDHRTFESVKVFNDSYAKIELIHASKNRNPFAIKITKGKADNQKKLVKGSEKIAMQWFGAEEFYGMWDDLYDKLRDWEQYHSALLFREYEPLTEKAIAQDYAERQNQQNSGQPYTQQNTQPAANYPNNGRAQQQNFRQQNSQRNNGYAVLQRNTQPAANYPNNGRTQQQNYRQQNSQRNNGYAAPPPPMAVSNDSFSAPFEETANYGSAYKQ